MTVIEDITCTAWAHPCLTLQKVKKHDHVNFKYSNCIIAAHLKYSDILKISTSFIASYMLIIHMWLQSCLQEAGVVTCVWLFWRTRPPFIRVRITQWSNWVTMTTVYPEEHVTPSYTKKHIYTVVAFYSMVDMERQEELLALTMPLFYISLWLLHIIYTLETYEKCFKWTEHTQVKYKKILCTSCIICNISTFRYVWGNGTDDRASVFALPNIVFYIVILYSYSKHICLQSAKVWLDSSRMLWI